MKLSDIVNLLCEFWGSPSIKTYFDIGHHTDSNIWYVLEGGQLVIEEKGLIGHKATGYGYGSFVAWGRVDHKIQKISARAHKSPKTAAYWGGKVARQMKLGYEVICFSPHGDAQVCG